MILFCRNFSYFVSFIGACPRPRTCTHIYLFIDVEYLFITTSIWENGSRVKLFHSFYYHLIAFAYWKRENERGERDRLSVREKPYIANRFICVHRTMYTWSFSMERREETRKKFVSAGYARCVLCVCVHEAHSRHTETHRECIYKYWKSTTIRIVIIIITMGVKCVFDESGGQVGEKSS